MPPVTDSPMAMSTVTQIVNTSMRPTSPRRIGEDGIRIEKSPDAEADAKSSVKLRGIQKQSLEPVHHRFQDSRHEGVGRHEDRAR